MAKLCNSENIHDSQLFKLQLNKSNYVSEFR